MIPEKVRLPLGAAGTIAVIVASTFASSDSADNNRVNRMVSLFGLIVFIGSFYATSRDRKNINWQAVIVGVLAQFLLALFVLRTKAGVSSQNDVVNLILRHIISTISLTSLLSWRNLFSATLLTGPYSSRPRASPVWAGFSSQLSRL
jgi:predicted Na+-dependent transporter